jgi:hypothetical protein
VDDVPPQAGVGDPGLAGIPEEVDDLRADVRDARGPLLDVEQVDDRRALLDQVAVPLLGRPEGDLGTLALDGEADDRGDPLQEPPYG